MKCTRVISLLLTGLMVLGALSGCGGGTAGEEPIEQTAEEKPAEQQNVSENTIELDDELQRASNIGLLPEEWLSSMDEPVTIAEFNSLLTKIVEMQDPALVPAWENAAVHALQKEDPAQRDDAILSIFEAAMVMGIDAIEGNSTEDGWEGKVPGVDWWEGRSDDYDYFPNWSTMYDDGDGEKYNIQSHSAWYVERHLSLVSRAYMFEPTEKWTFGFDQIVTKEEAVRALLRFAESNKKIVERFLLDEVYTAEAKEVLANAEQRKQVILNSETVVEYTGTAYYVSNGGSDENDGLTPETAWATLDMVNHAGENGRLESGDAVFFERGGLWRGYLDCAEGVTYSAYGEGEKPKIYGSPENGADPNKWELWYDRTGVKIWKFYQDTTDVGNIVFNNGEECAYYRVYAYYNGSEWVVSGDDQRPFDIVENLTEDMQFYSTFELTAAQFEQYKQDLGSDVVWADSIDTSGPLYLRCDRGNPGELYQDIEFQAMPDGLRGYIGLVTPAGNNVIDNLCLRYCVVNGIAMYNENGQIEGNDNNVIQNCEIGWMGGDQHDLKKDDGTVMVCGEAIVFKTHNNIIRNNYIYQAAQGTFVGEFVSGEYIDGASMASGNVFEGNLVEHCQYGFWFWDNFFDGSDGTRTEFWNDTVIRDNIMLYMGIDTWYSNEKVYFPGKEEIWEDSWALKNGSSIEFTGKMLIENNVFYLSSGELIGLDIREGDDQIICCGNTYVQIDYRDINQYFYYESIPQENVLEAITRFWGDTEATVFTPFYALGKR